MTFVFHVFLALLATKASGLQGNPCKNANVANLSKMAKGRLVAQVLKIGTPPSEQAVQLLADAPVSLATSGSSGGTVHYSEWGLSVSLGDPPGNTASKSWIVTEVRWSEPRSSCSTRRDNQLARAVGALCKVLSAWASASVPANGLNNNTPLPYSEIQTNNDFLCLALTRNGKYLASSGQWGGNVLLWDTANRQCISTLKGHTERVVALAFSPDNQRLASGAADNTVMLWNPTKDNTGTTCKGHTDLVICVAFSPDGKLLASGSADATIKLWDTASGKNVATFKGHDDIVWSVAFSPDGKSLASASGDRTVKVWSATTGAVLRTWRGYENAVRCVAFLSGGKAVASGDEGGTLLLWNLQENNPFRIMKTTLGVISLAVTADGSKLVVGQANSIVKRGEVITLNLTSGEECVNLLSISSTVWCVTCDASGELTVSGDSRGRISFWRGQPLEAKLQD